MPAYLPVYVVAAALLAMAIICFYAAWHRDQRSAREADLEQASR